jgi:phenylalanyl-tRNA synthetase beta chain
MIISYNWLKEYVELDYDIDTLEKKVSLQGIEVEGIHKIGGHIDDIVIGQITDIKKHPNADKLSVCQVNIGEETKQIICGAPNVWDKENPKVIVAKEGCYLPAVDLKIKKAKIRGEVSRGMICSEEELGLSEKSEGIWLLPDDAKVGEYPKDFLPDEDYIIDIAITANRGDLTGVIGFAREIAAMNETKVKYPKPEFDENKNLEKPKIKILDPDLCYRFTSRVIKGIKVGESPDWLKTKLKKLGQRPINNIVDISNYVMFELGHPNHIYDLNKLKNGEIVVRRARDGEKMTTLDDIERKLTSDMLVIADKEDPVGVAGVMGSESSEVSPGTTDVLLEAAYFNPVSIRRTAKRLGLSTEASYRFERNVDVEGTKLVIERLTKLIIEMCGGEAVSPMEDNYPNRIKPTEMDFSINYLEKMAGHPIPKNKTKQILEAMEFKVEDKSEDILHLTVPTFKTDVLRPIDVVEEVTRVYGFNNIPDKIFPITLNPDILDTRIHLKDKIRNILVGFGLTEFVNHSFTYQKDIDMMRLPKEKSVKILNPFTKDTELLRQSLLPNMIQNVIFNTSRGNRNVFAFEVGRTFQMIDGKEKTYKEVYNLGLVLHGDMEDKGLYNRQRKADFFDIKGIVEELLHNLDIDNLTFRPSQSPLLHQGKSADIIIEGRIVGFIGELHPIIANDYKLSGDTLIGELDIHLLEEIKTPRKKFRQISKFPPVYRDANFEIDKGVTHEQLSKAISEAGGKILESFRLVDIYVDDKLEKEDKKSMTYEFVFQDIKQTLEDKVVDGVLKDIIERVKKKTGGTLRGA